MKDIKTKEELKIGVIYHSNSYGSCKLSADKQEDLHFDEEGNFYITPLNQPRYCLWSNIHDLKEFETN